MKVSLVIIHGWNQNSSHWSILVKMFQKIIPVIIFDLPGFGNEPLQNKNWSIPEYATWVAQKIESTSGDKILLGHSFGGRIASYIASSNPLWLKGLIIYGAPCIYRPSSKIKLKIFIAKILKFLKLKNLFIVKNAELLNADNNGLGKIFRNAVNFDQTKSLPNIKAPTMLIWGEYDSAVPLRIAYEIDSLVQESKLVVMDQVGHNAHSENPYLFYGITKKFIETL